MLVVVDASLGIKKTARWYEVHRFKTLMDNSENDLVWDIPRLLYEIKMGVLKTFKKYKIIEPLSIDTWGADYVLMNGGKEITPYYAYRNSRNEKSLQKAHKIIKFDELYAKTSSVAETLGHSAQVFVQICNRPLGDRQTAIYSNSSIFSSLRPLEPGRKGASVPQCVERHSLSRGAQKEGFFLA